MKKFLALSLVFIICLAMLSSCGDFKELYNDVSAKGEESLAMVQEFVSEFFIENYDGATSKAHPSSIINKENLEKMRSDVIAAYNLTNIDSSTPISFTKFALDSTPIMNENGKLVHTQHTVIFKVEIAGVTMTAHSIVLQDDLGFGIYTFRIN